MYCKSCGSKIDNDMRYCPQCGAELNANNLSNNNSVKKSFWQHGWFTLLMLFVCFPVGLVLLWINHGKFGKILVSVFLFLVIGLFSLVSCSVIGIGENKNALNDLINSSSDRSLPGQKVFNDKIIELQDKIKTTDTDLKKAVVLQEYVSFLDKYLADGSIKDWYAVVDRIEAVDNENAANVELSVQYNGLSYKLATDQYSFYGEKTIISNNSVLYKSLVDLKAGDKVIVSGKILRDSMSGNFTKPYSGDMALLYPEFKIRFTNISKVE